MKHSMIIRSSLSCLLMMMMFTITLGQQKIRTNDGAYQVVINHEEQYSILLQSQPVPKGCKAVGTKGDLKACQDYIQEVWTDMRPLSIRQMNLPAKTDYEVVINHEEQYSIFPKGRKAPQGWKSIGVSGNRKYCQSYIEGVWTDMRPLSLQKRLNR